MAHKINWNQLVREFSEPAKKTVEARVPTPARRPNRLRLATRKLSGQAVNKTAPSRG